MEKLNSDGIVQALQSVIVEDRLRNAGFEGQEAVILPNLDRAEESELRELLNRVRALGVRTASAA